MFFWHGASVDIGRDAFSELLHSRFHVRLLGILATWKCYSSKIMRVSDEGYLAFIALLFGIHVCFLGILASRCCSSRVMRTSYQGYLAFVDWLFGILKTWKSVSSSVLRPSAEGLCDHRCAILDFMMPWKCKSYRVVRPWAQASSGKLYCILTS
jgi:hypothetical protein